MFGLYIHTPFCEKKCHYCDFNSRCAGPGEIEAYLDALIEELTLFSRGNRRIVETLYIGGGTPTLLSAGAMEKLFDAVHHTMTLVENAEITVEANPGTLDRIKAVSLLSLGVNRVSLGVQSLDDTHLRRIGRSHDAADAVEALEDLGSAGFQNVSCDLIYGLPGQTLKDWERDLHRLIEMGPEHLSLYGLTVEEGTPFDRERGQGTLDLPCEEEQIAMHNAALRQTRDSGYEHYEISNYARPGYGSRHNSIYWTMEEYYGAGAGAHSFLTMDGPIRLANVSDPAVYIQRMQGTKDPVAKRELIRKKTFLSEAMMLGLRMSQGVEISGFQKRFGEDPLGYFSGCFRRAFENDWIEIVNGRIRLTPKGLLFSNEVFADLF